MATQLQDLQAKRKELQATNPNATMLDAKNALAPAISNAPVAGVAPAVTNPVGQSVAPTAPVSVHDNPTYQSSTTEQYNQGVLARNKAKVAGQIQSGERPAVGTQATPAQTPAIIQQTAGTITPSGATMNPDGTVTPKVETPPVNQKVNQPATAEEQAINQKLGGFIQSNGLNSVQELQKEKGTNLNTVSNFKGFTAPSSRDIAVNNKLNQYSSMSSQQFVDLMKQGQIPSSLSSQLATTNPQFQQAQQEYSQFLKTNNINTSGKAVFNAMTGGQTEQAVNPLEAISNSLLKAFGVDGTQQSYVDAFKESIAQNDAIKTKTLELNAKQSEIDEKTQARDNILKDYKKQYNGVPLSTLIAMAARDAEPINQEITTLQRDVAQLSSDLKFETELAKGEYDAKVKDMEAKTGIRNTILGNLMNAQFGLATKQMEAQMAEQIAQQAFNNPMKAIPAMIDEYKKLGIPFERSTQEIVADFQASGQDLASYLTDLQKTVQSKPEYQQYLDKKKGEGISYQAFGDKVYKNVNGVLTETAISNAKPTEAKAPEWAQDMDGNWYNKNSSVSPAEQVSSGTVDTGGATFFDALGQNVGTYTGNRGIDLAGNIGDPLFAGGDWKVISTDTAGEQKGSIFQPGKGSKPYGNTVVMEDAEGNKIRFSHLDSVNVKKDDVLGYGTVLGTRGNTGNVLGKNGEKLTAEQLAAGRGAHVDIEIMDKSGRLLSEAEQKAYLQGIKQPNPFETTNLSLYRAYAEDGKLPSKDALKGLKMNSQKFIQNADAGYAKFLENEAKNISKEQPTLDIVYNPQRYSANSPTQREKLNESVTKIGDIDRRMTRLRELFEENGTETWPTAAKSEMQSLRQQIILKAKEVENLGVLNGPDLGILEDLLPGTTGFWSGVGSLDSNTLTKLKSLQSNYRNDAKTKSVNYGAKLIFADPVEKELAASF